MCSSAEAAGLEMAELLRENFEVELVRKVPLGETQTPVLTNFRTSHVFHSEQVP